MEEGTVRERKKYTLGRKVNSVTVNAKCSAYGDGGWDLGTMGGVGGEGFFPGGGEGLLKIADCDFNFWGFC